MTKVVFLGRLKLLADFGVYDGALLSTAAAPKEVQGDVEPVIFVLNGELNVLLSSMSVAMWA